MRRCPQCRTVLNEAHIGSARWLCLNSVFLTRPAFGWTPAQSARGSGLRMESCKPSTAAWWEARLEKLLPAWRRAERGGRLWVCF